MRRVSEPVLNDFVILDVTAKSSTPLANKEEERTSPDPSTIQPDEEKEVFPWESDHQLLLEKVSIDVLQSNTIYLSQLSHLFNQKSNIVFNIIKY